MPAEVRVWLLIVGMAAVAFLSRAIFILPGSRLSLPPTVEKVLRYAPAAALVAIIVPDLFRVDGVVVLSVDNPRVVAGAVALVVAARTRNILLTIAGGMAALLLAGLVWR
ncbi:MAG: AzlD domain-containing protein [Acidobacteria bacterium]|nr:AzlD domain-containing protein [Acidobacteriota bacterium]